MNAVFTVLTCLTAFATLLTGAWIFDIHNPNTDAAGRGLAGAFTGIVVVITFLMLGAMLLMCGVRGAFSTRWGIFVAIIYLLAAATQIVALMVVTDLRLGDRFDLLLRLLFPIAPSLLIIFAAMDFYRVPAANTKFSLAISVVLMSVVTLATSGSAKSAGKIRDHREQLDWSDALERDRTRAAEVHALPADTPLASFLPYLEGAAPHLDSDARREAVRRMSGHPDRQAQAESVLDHMDLRILPVLTDLNLTVTPTLCAAARKSLAALATEIRPTPEMPLLSSIDRKTTAFTVDARWLLQNGCDCKAEVAALEKNVGLYPDPYPKKFLVDYLLELQGKPRE
jgi:hypothetical protein